MLANRASALLLILLCLSGAGCAHSNTRPQYDASFLSYKETKIEETSLQRYLDVRSGYLLCGKNVTTNSTSEPSFHITGTSPVGFGTAAAIDQRGYFLTAAHCLAHGPVWLGYLRDGKAQVERPRIVWCGDVKKGEPDLAILRVTRPISQAFQWAAEFTNGSPVVNMGFNLADDYSDLAPDFAAGKVLNVSESLNAGSFDYSVVAHSSPLFHGDSGGPLVLFDGRLLGINVRSKWNFRWRHLSYEREHNEAYRPNLAWLREIIDADWALPSPAPDHAAANSNP